MEFDVFISYSRKDSQVVKQFVSEINNAGYKEWIDKKGISGGDTYQSKIVDAIDNSAIVLFFSSAESNASQRVIDEICYAQSTNKTIIPIKLDDTRYNREFILRLNRINSIQYDADHPLSSYQELISSIEDKTGKPANPAPTKSPEELFELGKSLYNKEDHENAVKYYKPAAEQGYAAAQNNLGNCFYFGNGVTQDYKEAVKWYQKAAEQGYSIAQYNLGYCYEKGLGITQDYQEAVKWYRKAAEQGYSFAQCNLGYCYEYGLGVAQDIKEAVKWYRNAAEQGHAQAQNNLGICYRVGHGVTQDYQEAVKWYRKAAEQGHAGAQCDLGYCYENGLGVTQYSKEAVKWYRKAAEQGDATSQYNLGNCYNNGWGVKKDKQEAITWYRKAAEQGYENAIKALKRLKA